MGISASQARLLTITARLTSNEYESQQISNAKMRLATQSEAASSEYIAALNSTQLQLMTYDAKGEATTTPLTANALYQYSDLKNQYALVNTSGQVLISNGDAENFERASNLDEFLESYGITKEFKSNALAENFDKLAKTSDEGGVADYYDEWEAAINELKSTGMYENENGETITANDDDYYNEKQTAFAAYTQAMESYDNALIKYNAQLYSDADLEPFLNTLAEAKTNYANYATYDQYIKSKLAYVSNTDANGNTTKTFSELYKNAEKYYAVLADFQAEADNLGCKTTEDTYAYSDDTKAQWYTNLWYRLNGSSTEKSAQGQYGTNYAILDNKLATSTQWIQDALTQGAISLEKAAYTNATNTTNDPDNPFNVTLKGISWTSAIYSNCSDFTQADNDSAVAKAEAEYTRKTNEIDAKDTKYENKIKTLDTEHNTLQTEYEAVQTAMSKNIDRSFKTFNG